MRRGAVQADIHRAYDSHTKRANNSQTFTNTAESFERFLGLEQRVAEERASRTEEFVYRIEISHEMDVAWLNRLIVPFKPDLFEGRPEFCALRTGSDQRTEGGIGRDVSITDCLLVEDPDAVEPEIAESGKDLNCLFRPEESMFNVSVDTNGNAFAIVRISDGLTMEDAARMVREEKAIQTGRVTVSDDQYYYLVAIYSGDGDPLGSGIFDSPEREVGEISSEAADEANQVVQ